MCYLLCPVAETARFLPLIHPHLLPVDQRPPPDLPPGRTYSALKSALKRQLLQEWMLQSPHPRYNPYLPTLIPHPFMGLDRLTVGRIHQMGAGKSSFTAHTDWGDTDTDKTCPVCEQGEETFEQAILHYKCKTQQRVRPLPAVASVGQDH